MNHFSHVFSQSSLQHTFAWILTMLPNHFVDLVKRNECEHLNETLRIFIRLIEPELIELIWACLLSIKPNVTFFRLTKLSTVSLGHKRPCKHTCVITTDHSTDKLNTSCTITVLVTTTNLQFAVVLLVKLYKVVTLNQLIGKLCE